MLHASPSGRANFCDAYSVSTTDVELSRTNTTSARGKHWLVVGDVVGVVVGLVNVVSVDVGVVDVVGVVVGVVISVVVAVVVHGTNCANIRFTVLCTISAPWSHWSSLNVSSTGLLAIFFNTSVLGWSPTWNTRRMTFSRLMRKSLRALSRAPMLS